MASPTDDQRFPLPGSHPLHPLRFLTPSPSFQVFQGADMVHLDFLLRTAEFTGIRQEALHQLRPLIVLDRRGSILEDCLTFSPEGDAPQQATSGFLPASRSTTTFSPARGPCGVWR